MKYLRKITFLLFMIFCVSGINTGFASSSGERIIPEYIKYLLRYQMENNNESEEDDLFGEKYIKNRFNGYETNII